MADPSGRRLVVVGTENRQNMLGHLALLGARRPTQPLASGGPPEGRIAGALTALLADWADRCRAAGGLVVAAHFPLPYAEIAADIVSGKIDAIEAQALAPGLDDPAMLEWYRFLDLGYRLPIVAGTDKMSAEVPVGAVRTYTHLLTDEALTFDAWAAAVRAGRTFVTSGPILELTVDGREPGEVIQLSSPGHLEVVARARASQPVIGGVELVVGGRVVARVEAATAATELTLHETIVVEAGTWIAARTRSEHVIQSAFTTSMARTRRRSTSRSAIARSCRRGRGGGRRADDRRCPDLGRRARGDRRPGRPRADGRLLRGQPRDVARASRRIGTRLTERRPASAGQAVGSSGIEIGRPVQSSATQAYAGSLSWVTGFVSPARKFR